MDSTADESCVGTPGGLTRINGCITSRYTPFCADLNSALPDHVHGFDALQGPPRCREFCTDLNVLDEEGCRPLSKPRCLSAAGNAKARDLVSYFVGQGVGLIDSVKSAGAVVQEFKEDFVEAIEHMNALVAE